MIKIFNKLLAKQLSHPQGLLSYFILRKLNKMNANIINQTIALSDIHDNHIVLDIGFGGGLSFDILQQRNLNLKLYGLERSKKAISSVQQKFQQIIADNVLTLKYGNVEKIPFKAEFFDRIISINTVYFWDNLDVAFSEVRRILKPQGSFILALREKEVLRQFPPTKYGFHFYDTEEIISSMKKAGFAVSIIKKEDKHPFICIKAY